MTTKSPGGGGRWKKTKVLIKPEPVDESIEPILSDIASVKGEEVVDIVFVDTPVKQEVIDTEESLEEDMFSDNVDLMDSSSDENYV
jgi:hypothetical protein